MNVISPETMELLWRYVNAILVTLGVSLLAAFIGMVIGFTLNALRICYARQLSIPYRLLVWLIRGTPYFSQLMIVYFGLPVIGLTLSAAQATVASLALYSAVYFAEIFRSGWNSIAPGHLEAAQAFGINRWQSLRHIEMPQALIFALPLLGNQTVLVIKESAVASVITLPELTMTTGEIVSSTYNYVGPYALLILGYWLLAQTIALAVRGCATFVTSPQRTL